MSNSAISGSTIIDFPAGMIMPYAGNLTPAGWLECDGSEIDIAQYPALSAALGSTWNNAKNPLTGASYANPAAGKFRLPDLRGSFLRGSSNGASNAQGVATGLAEFQSNKTAKNGLSASAGTSSISSLTLNSNTTSVSGAKNQLNFSTGVQSVNHSHGIGSDGNHNHYIGHVSQVGDGYGDRLRGVYQGYGGNDGYSNYAGSHSHGGGTGGISANHTHSGSYSGNFSASGTTPGQTLSSSSVNAPSITVSDGDSETRPDAVGVRYLIKI